MTLGINSLNFDFSLLKKYKFEHLEVCLGRKGSYKDRLNRSLNLINDAQKRNVNLSVHLPIYLFDWYPYDYLSAFFIHSDKDKREISFKLLEKNLKRLKNFNISFLVLHFPGINHKDKNIENFEKILNNSLNKVNKLAKKYNQKILLEYFGSNILFADYNIWIEKIKKFSNLGILLDTGHLYFSSILNDFDFNKAFNKLKENSEAFHFWTTKGKDIYGNNEFYQKYHHIIPNISQKKNNNWAFDTKEIYESMIGTNKPIIIEASPFYKGENYYYKSIDTLSKMI
ncbi:MAG: TIM barrel protein [Bacillota bacterium]